MSDFDRRIILCLDTINNKRGVLLPADSRIQIDGGRSR